MLSNVSVNIPRKGIVGPLTNLGKGRPYEIWSALTGANKMNNVVDQVSYQVVYQVWVQVRVQVSNQVVDQVKATI